MPGGEKNTYGLPDGEAIRREMVAIFREQRLAILGWMDAEGYKAFGLPISWPSWESLRLGAGEIASRIRQPIADIWEASDKAWLASHGSPVTFDVTVPPISTRIDAQANQLGNAVNSTTTGRLNQLLTSVTDLFNRGEKTLRQSIKALRDGIAEKLKGMGRARAIGITEASRAYHDAIGTVARNSGVVIGWRWMTAEDPCPICQAIEERAPVVQIDHPFAIIGDGQYGEVQFPPAHVNCRCSMAEVTIDDDIPEWFNAVIDPAREAVLA